MTNSQRFFCASLDFADAYLSKTLCMNGEPILSNSMEQKSKGIAYYPIFGFISDFKSYYTPYPIREFERDLKRNDEYSSVRVHFVHINSGGGEAWYIDQLILSLRSLKKPIYCLAEQICASAAYYISSAATRLVTLNQFDRIGSIGSMTIVHDDTEAQKKWGLHEIVLKSSKSDLKNKDIEDVLAGNTKHYIEKFIDPVQVEFEKNVRANRKKLAKLPEDHPVFRGEIFYASEALKLGLIDAIVGTTDRAITEAVELGNKFKNQQTIFNSIL